MDIDWRVLTYLVVGFFALNGFFRGWWKEAVTTIFLVLLLVLLQIPGVAQLIIDAFNQVVALIQSLLPANFNFPVFQADAGSSGTWLVILVVGLGLVTLLARSFLPGTYAVGPIGRLLGLVMGAVNGFLVLNLVREYLDGRGLPGNAPPAAATRSQLTLLGTGNFGPASSNLSVRATGLPGLTILDSFIPWFVIGLGLFILLAVLRNRVAVARHPDGGRKLEYKPPYGYTRAK